MYQLVLRTDDGYIINTTQETVVAAAPDHSLGGIYIRLLIT